MILIAVIIIPYALMMGVKLPRRATVVIITGEKEELDLKFEDVEFNEVIVEENVWTEVEMDSEGQFDVDEFYTYWMKITDPRYIKDKEAFDFEQSSGSGEWDY